MTGLCPRCGEPWKGFKQGKTKTTGGPGPITGGCQLSWRQENSQGDQRQPCWGVYALPLFSRGAAQSTGHQGVAEPTPCKNSPGAPGAWGLNHHFLLCFPAGSECATSCLDHNSEPIILPVNVTIREIPHWLNPTRVEVSDGLPAWGEGEENDCFEHLLWPGPALMPLILYQIVRPACGWGLVHNHFSSP